MRPVSLFLLLTTLTGVGVAAARPDVVLPVAGRFIEPLFAQQAERPKAEPPKAEPKSAVSIGIALPSFAPVGRDLSFNGADEEGGPSASGDAPAAATSAPAATSAVEAVADQKKSAALEPPTAPRVTVAPITPSSPPEAEKPVAALTPQAEAPPAKGTSGKSAKSPPVVAAKLMFGAVKTPAPLASRAIGTYARGCLAGGVMLPVDGPAWQAMRLARNRNWGHPDLIKLVERLGVDAKKLDGWNGLLVGDISQPRGGPMLTGHASHQLGLDADVWLTPMPNRTLSERERNEMSATSMLDKTEVAVDSKVFTDKHVRLIKRAASYPQVERVLVHPAIKKALCLAAGSDRRWLGKVRPIGGHFYHFHIRIGCPAGFAGCKPQVPPTGDDGCGKEVEQWLARVAPPKGPPKPKPPGYKPPPSKPPLTLAELPPECKTVLASGPDGLKPHVFAKSVHAMPLPKLSSVFAGAALRPYLKRLGAEASAN